MKYLIFITAVFAYLLISCEKTTDPEPNEIIDELGEVSTYSLLKTGNYWVYQTYSCTDTEGMNCSERTIDSVYVSKDTIIKRKRYYKVEGTNFGQYFVKFLRDSSDYLVNEKNEKLFSCVDFQNIINENFYIINNDTLAKLSYKMQKHDFKIIVPAGEFDVLNCRGEVYRMQDDYSIPYFVEYFYAKNAGIVKQNSFYLNSLNKIYRELIRYNINIETL